MGSPLFPGSNEGKAALLLSCCPQPHPLPLPLPLPLSPPCCPPALPSAGPHPGPPSSPSQAPSSHQLALSSPGSPQGPLSPQVPWSPLLPSPCRPPFPVLVLPPPFQPGLPLCSSLCLCPGPPSGPGLASSHLARLLSCPYSPPTQSPPPPISPPLGQPANQPRDLTSPPGGTWISGSSVSRAAAGHKEQHMPGLCGAALWALQCSRKPLSPQ